MCTYTHTYILFFCDLLFVFIFQEFPTCWRRFSSHFSHFSTRLLTQIYRIMAPNDCCNATRCSTPLPSLTHDLKRTPPQRFISISLEVCKVFGLTSFSNKQIVICCKAIRYFYFYDIFDLVFFFLFSFFVSRV